MKPANFYVWHTSLECYALVRLTADTPIVQWGDSARTDEGWSSWYEEYRLTPDGVVVEGGTDGRDCDGRLATFGRSFCPHDKLASVKPYRCDGEDPPDIMLPEWSEVSRGQRDYAAEAMGY
jgi:hypothetical protein